MPKTLRWTLIVLTGLLVLYTVAWFAVARVVDLRVADALEDMRLSGINPVCTERTMVGFPLAMTMTCTTTGAKPLNALPFQAGKLAISAPFTDPGLLTANLTSPATYGSGDQQVTARWDDMVAKVDATLGGTVQQFSYDMANLNVTAGPHSLATDTAQLALTPDTENPADLVATLTTNAVQAALPYGRNLAATDLLLSLHLEDGATDLFVQRKPLADILADGANIRIDLLRADMGEGILAASGPLTLSPDGLLSGTIAVGMKNREALAQWAASLDPNAAQMVASLAQAVAGMGTEQEFGGETVPAIDLTLDEGDLRLGFIRLGRIPPLRLN